MVPSDSLIIEAERHAGWRRRKMERETEGGREREMVATEVMTT